MKRRLKLVSVKDEVSFLKADDQKDVWQKNHRHNDDDTFRHDTITTLYQEYNETLVRYLAIRLRSRQDAIDVAQEAYIRLIRKETLDDIDCFQSYLFRTATNISIDFQRQKTRHAHNYTKSKSLFSKVDEITPERTMNGQQTLNELTKAVENLPPKCREAFMMYKFRNMDHGEIAEKMGLSISSIRKYIARALAYCIQEIDR